MPCEGPYSRVYHTVINDVRFADVIGDDAAMGTWIKLLVAADAAWPASAFLPRWVRPKPLSVLTRAGIVEVSGDLYRIHGLDPERETRAVRASHAAAVRWGSRGHRPEDADGNAGSSARRNPRRNPSRNAGSTADSNAFRNAEAMPRREEKRRDENQGSTATPGAVAHAREEATPGAEDWFTAAVDPVESAG